MGVRVYGIPLRLHFSYVVKLGLVSFCLWWSLALEEGYLIIRRSTGVARNSHLICCYLFVFLAVHFLQLRLLLPFPVSQAQTRRLFSY